MPREGTKTVYSERMKECTLIEIRYAPGGDENETKTFPKRYVADIEIRYAPGGDENYQKKNAVLSDEEKN